MSSCDRLFKNPKCKRDSGVPGKPNQIFRPLLANPIHLSRSSPRIYRDRDAYLIAKHPQQTVNKYFFSTLSIWCEHLPEPVTENDFGTSLWDFELRSDRASQANRHVQDMLTRPAW